LGTTTRARIASRWVSDPLTGTSSSSRQASSVEAAGGIDAWAVNITAGAVASRPRCLAPRSLLRLTRHSRAGSRTRAPRLPAGA
jgi:hypothetical protein